MLFINNMILMSVMRSRFGGYAAPYEIEIEPPLVDPTPPAQSSVSTLIYSIAGLGMLAVIFIIFYDFQLKPY